MNRIVIISLLLLISLTSCIKSEKDTLYIAKQYYKALDNSDSSKMKNLLADSILTAVPKYDYKLVYSLDEYVDKWLKWDSVFTPNYEILEIKEENGIVKAKVSKNDKRIFFLHRKPFITNETLKFYKNKIVAIETAYMNFDETTWGKNKTELLNWVNEKHPELNGFIYDQTERGGMKYLRAIELYNTEK